MICRIRGNLIKKESNRLVLDVGGIFYEVNVPATVSQSINESCGQPIELVTFHYLKLEKSKATPVLVGFSDELEKDFFEKFISVSGVGPKAALRAFDKPVADIAQAIEEGDAVFLTGLAGVGKQRAKQIVAHLQGKVGRFALIKGSTAKKESVSGEIVQQAKEILRRLQYSGREAESMIKKALGAKPQVAIVEDLLNEIYRQRK